MKFAAHISVALRATLSKGQVTGQIGQDIVNGDANAATHRAEIVDGYRV